MKSKIQYSGIMTSYVCSAECRHCMYCSSPKAGKDFITADTSESIADTLRRENVGSMHIGGGEPFLNVDSLYGLLRAMQRYNIGVDYIETNAFWCRDEKTVREQLTAIHKSGVRTVMVSVDPFHIEYIPLNRPLLLVRLLEENGLDYFIWQEKFMKRLSLLDHTRTYTHEELKKHLGDKYIENTVREYGLGLNGRALVMADKLYKRKLAETFFFAGSCSALLDGRHCHIDPYNNYIPSGCPGISVALNDYFSGNISSEKYPVVASLLRGGVGELFKYAAAYGFEPSDLGYVSKCELCFFIRDYLRKKIPSHDLGPECFYNAMTAAYVQEEIKK